MNINCLGKICHPNKNYSLHFKVNFSLVYFFTKTKKVNKYIKTSSNFFKINVNEYPKVKEAKEENISLDRKKCFPMIFKCTPHDFHYKIPFFNFLISIRKILINKILNRKLTREMHKIG